MGKLWVRDRDAGKVIGRGGETVRDIMEKTGADIKVQKADEMSPGTRERLVQILGQKEQQDQALQLVLAEVVWARGEEGLIKGQDVEEQEALEKKDDRVKATREKEEGRKATSSKAEKTN